MSATVSSKTSSSGSSARDGAFPFTTHRGQVRRCSDCSLTAKETIDLTNCVQPSPAQVSKCGMGCSSYAYRQLAGWAQVHPTQTSTKRLHKRRGSRIDDGNFGESVSFGEIVSEIFIVKLEDDTLAAAEAFREEKDQDSEVEQ